MSVFRRTLANGQCLWCTNQTDDWQSMCAPCLAKQSARYRAKVGKRVGRWVVQHPTFGYLLRYQGPNGTDITTPDAALATVYKKRGNADSCLAHVLLTWK